MTDAYIFDAIRTPRGILKKNWFFTSTSSYQTCIKNTKKNKRKK